ncbi:hypothetical protein ACWOC1_12110 [Enterococcus quebecensis]|uniref:Uncharacterized protein n=1 Tax=Enterococcus quebecensis TaxID=903983 RepID=A0A1E5GSZ1_9ENTE|nr:hypothetical protein [Enterococcus quebecensis]OEG15801.1 hypothetical protein BCR23_06540 [Enterococcus quebecensis]OJG73616.1 hypothetical protein RV12_GL000631 [Enterococcus quebecensis]
MLNGMLELTDRLGLDYYFVSISLENTTLIVRSLNDYCKPLDKAVNLAEIKGVISEKEGQFNFICFDYENEHYHFVDYGNYLFPFLKNILFPLRSH